MSDIVAFIKESVKGYKDHVKFNELFFGDTQIAFYGPESKFDKEHFSKQLECFPADSKLKWHREPRITEGKLEFELVLIKFYPIESN